MMTKIACFILIFAIMPSAFAYSLDDAVQSVQSEGKVISAKSRQVNGQTIYFIRILTTDGRLKRYKLNAETARNRR